MVGDCENKANSAQLGLAGALAELGNDPHTTMKRILYDMGNFFYANRPSYALSLFYF